MAARLSKFEPVADVNGLFTATKGDLRCTAIVLKSGGLCLFSPVAGLNDQAKASLADLGPVEFLFAPNHYHNKGLAEYQAAYPTAKTIASDAGRPRLARVTGLDFQGTRELSRDFEDGMRLETPCGLKTGEVWIITPSARGVAWLVVDAFAGSKGGTEQGTDHVRLLGTFPRYGVGDRPTYTNWLTKFLDCEPPDVLIPCHGQIDRGADLNVRLQKLIADLI